MRALTPLLAALSLMAFATLRGEGPDALDQLNAAFRAGYGQAKARQLKGATLVVDGDRLLLLHGEAAVAEAVVRPFLYHRLKAVDHVALALYLRLSALPEAPLSPEDLGALTALRVLAEKAKGALGASFPEGSLLQRQRRILDRCLQVLDGALPPGRPSRAQLARFAGDLSPLLMRNAGDAAALQLEALHRAVSLWRKGMAPGEWSTLKVVILGAHMAREGEVSFQYFSRLLGQPAEGDRIVYAEGLGERKDALSLLATHGVDRDLGQAFFGNPARMHRDVMADAAASWLDAHAAEIH